MVELADETITHEATPIGYKTDASHPKGGRDEVNFVANAASQEIGSSTQALINGLPTVTGPRQLMRQPIHGS